MTGCERNHDNFPTPAFYFGGADDRVLGIVATLNYHVRLEVLDQIQRRIVRENYDEIYTFERAENIGALGVAAHRTCRTLESPHGFVTVDANDQCIGGLARSVKNVDVTGVKKIKNAIGEGNPAFLTRPPALSLHPGCNFAGWIPRLQSLLTADG